MTRSSVLVLPLSGRKALWSRSLTAIAFWLHDGWPERGTIPPYSTWPTAPHPEVVCFLVRVPRRRISSGAVICSGRSISSRHMRLTMVSQSHPVNTRWTGISVGSIHPESLSSEDSRATVIRSLQPRTGCRSSVSPL